LLPLHLPRPAAAGRPTTGSCAKPRSYRPAADALRRHPVQVSAGIQVGSVNVPEDELNWRFSRSSGPGGQGVNTADSRVELIYDLAASTAFPPLLQTRALNRLDGRLVAGTIVVVASENRSQLRNRQTARERLAAILAEATAPPPRSRRPTRPTLGSTRRRLEEKSRRSALKRNRRADED
jgi:ribosome-associated protein